MVIHILKQYYVLDVIMKFLPLAPFRLQNVLVFPDAMVVDAPPSINPPDGGSTVTVWDPEL
jgi:hypothetical protein